MGDEDARKLLREYRKGDRQALVRAVVDMNRRGAISSVDVRRYDIAAKLGNDAAYEVFRALRPREMILRPLLPRWTPPFDDVPTFQILVQQAARLLAPRDPVSRTRVKVSWAVDCAEHVIPILRRESAEAADKALIVIRTFQKLVIDRRVYEEAFARDGFFLQETQILDNYAARGDQDASISPVIANLRFGPLAFQRFFQEHMSVVVRRLLGVVRAMGERNKPVAKAVMALAQFPKWSMEMQAERSKIAGVAGVVVSLSQEMKKAHDDESRWQALRLADYVLGDVEMDLPPIAEGSQRPTTL